MEGVDETAGVDVVETSVDDGDGDAEEYAEIAVDADPDTVAEAATAVFDTCRRQ